ncbi:hypothetical protein CkaCkLH20_04266 [Colletotrichum karsti]|uniref:2EXR domain-containing protein n=1 Tax=Colletotrichum karsti TaxID=1095194 RepID=A0A9P6I6K7_9PEZI|nr:uncharacterized protein CkaCkLH20_04266 [Colletotrichum karsti]KAF9878228.1 hypothetical protein CkaCkLH20_04266 [Colletotrichum karsti]
MDLATIDVTSPFSRSFHKFRDLPAELRIRIWRLATPKSAVVERAVESTTMYGLRRHAPIPAVLQVCRESRAELLYESDSRRGASDEQFEIVYLSKEDRESRKGAYMNYASDTLLIYRAPQRAIMPDASNFANVQNLAMEWGLRPCWIQGQCHVGVKFIQQFPALKTLTLLVNFKLESDLPSSEPRRHRERRQQRRALHEIKNWVLDAVKEQEGPGWTPPEVRVVQKTKYWSGAPTSHDHKLRF